MTKMLTAAMIFAAGLVFVLSAADQAREQKLQQGIDLMESKGDMAKAMPLFEDAARSSDRLVAARALLYLGDAQERQGTAKARVTYERIVKEFANQTEIVAAARQRLSALGTDSTTLLAHKLVTKGDIGYDTLSPDGQWFGGTDYTGSLTGDLVLAHVSTGEIRRLVPGHDKEPESWAEWPLISPDQKQVAYWWFDYGDPEANGQSNNGQIRVIPNEPGAKPRVLFGKLGEYISYPYGWSPDGKLVLATRGRDQKQGAIEIVWISVGDNSVKLIKSIEPWRIPRGPGGFRLSPDGHYIAYAAKVREDAPETSIYVLSADGAAQTILVQDGMNQDPVWTPDGSHILFSSNRSGTFGLWSVPVRDGKRAGLPSLLKADTGTIRSLGMTRSGRYYYTYDASLTQVFVAEMDPVTGKARGSAVSVTESFVGGLPAWSRDGKWLAFRRPRPRSNNAELILHSMESGTNSATDGTGNGRPLWYLDGSVQINGSKGRMNVSGGAPREITAPLQLPMGLLSADDKLLYAPVNRQSINVIEVATGQRKQMFTVPGGVTGASLSPDGKTLSIVGGTGTGTWHLSRIAVDGSDYREIYSGVTPGQPAWTRDGRSILFVQQDKNSAVGRIMRIPIEGGQPEYTGISAEGLRDFDVSPDGSKIAYSGSSGGEEVWALDNVLSALK